MPPSVPGVAERRVRAADGATSLARRWSPGPLARWSGRCQRAPDDVNALDGTGGPLPSTEYGRTLMSAFATHRSRDNPGETWGVGHGSMDRTTRPSGTLDELGGTESTTTSRVTTVIPASRPESRVGSTDRASSVPPALCRGHVRFPAPVHPRNVAAGNGNPRDASTSIELGAQGSRRRHTGSASSPQLTRHTFDGDRSICRCARPGNHQLAPGQRARLPERVRLPARTRRLESSG